MSKTTDTPDPPTPAALTADTLLNLGFVDVAGWVDAEGDLDYALDGPHRAANELRLDERNALYAFVQGERVRYIGKTARTIAKRFGGYRRPGRGQATNVRCNTRIKAALAKREEVRIFVFTPISQLRYGAFDLNLAAGLEDALIAAFDPPWNGRERGQPISEEAEREVVEAKASPANRFAWNDGDVEFRDGKGNKMSTHDIYVGQTETCPARFTILLGTAYYHQGFINPGVEASEHLGRDGEPIEIRFSDGAESVVSRIDRTTNRTGSVRVVGRNGAIAAWFQKHYALGESVQARIVNSNLILLLAKG